MRKVEMLLEMDEFLVTYDPSKANDELLIETVKKSGYTAQVATDQVAKSEEKEITVLPLGFPILDKALAQAKAENKPLVLDFNAEWCVPCRRLEKEVFANPKLAAQLKKVILVRIDT
ncbi:MAG TPA: thioredoxin family protein, partial [Pyrinomonadaceae bacterium]|nr:thioredoxin family protein [Pyrinomonadaceae bacterium]